MALPHLPPSGVLGMAARSTGNAPPPEIHTAALRLGGAPWWVVSPARLYVCGITPYDVTHLGHAATFVWADALGCVLRMAGSDVLSSRNVTDVDDVLTAAAGARGRPYDEFALSQEYAFGQDMAALGVRRPTHEPRARHHITHVQQLGAALLAGGHAYLREGHVFFRGATAVQGAGLDRARALELAAEHGDDPRHPLAEDPFDVPVWRPSGETDPAWPSPWGWGRPGWHAECAAMALATLGPAVDALIGGADLAFPHHAYQAAMVEAASSVRPFARRRMQVGAVHQDGAKMAKSTGNLTLVADLLTEHRPAAVRLMLLDRRWSEPWDYRPELLRAAGSRLEELYAASGRPAGAPSGTAAVAGALIADLDVPLALDRAIEDGGEAARLLVKVLSLG